MLPSGQSSQSPAPAPGYRRICLIIASALFMENIDATVLATAVPTMARDLHVNAPSMSVAFTAYLLALAIFIPASGRAADRWGAKNVFRLALVVFMAGSLCCALAPNLPVLALARFSQGLGGAMMTPVGRLLLLRTVSKRELVSATTWLLMPALIGQIAGPPLGGLIVSYVDWRWIFWVNLPVGLLGSYLVARYIPDVREEGQRPFDLRGFLYSGAALTALLFGLEAGGRGAQWGLAAPLLAVGLALGMLYVRHARGHPHPILDLALLRVPTFRLSLVGGSLTRITQGAHPFLLPMMMQLAFGLKPSQSGLITMGTALGTFSMKGFAGPILRRWGFRSSMAAFGVAGACCYAVCGLFRPGWPMPLVFAVLVASGFLLSFQFTAYNTLAYDEVDGDLMSSATSFYATFQQLSMSLGVLVAASALHASMALGERASPVFADFSAAFWIVTGISLCAIFANLSLNEHAGREMSGVGR
jgi:EmrB/QacA subfamily drug resistance transporter